MPWRSSWLPEVSALLQVRADMADAGVLMSCAQSSYISGIAQGANVAESQVSIVGVTSASTVTVNTQVNIQSRG